MEKLSEIPPNKKTINNAIAAYILIPCSWLFLFNKTNKNLNNPFVKSHVKSSSLIHLGFIITYIIFVSNSLFSSIIILGFSLNHLIAKGLFIGLLGLLLIGMYKAKHKQIFFINSLNNIIKNKKLIDINNDKSVDEKDKLTIFLSYIPFVGFLNYAKYRNNELIKNITKLNLIISIIIISLYIVGNINLSNLLLLAYTIYTVFVGITLFVKDEIININLKKIPSFEELIIIIASLKTYLYNYFKDKDFKNLNKIIETEKQKNKVLQEDEERALKLVKDIKIPEFLIYIPIVNLIFLFVRNSKYKYHFVNGIMITFILGVGMILKLYGFLNSNIYLLIIIPILFGIGYAHHYLSYKMPFIYQIYEFFVGIKNLLIFKGKKINEKRKEVNEVSLKVGEK